ncbi:MAG: hypothetical protein EBR91_08165 [Flavobacteriia bacterium]|jgi:hypothetical protein|nr:hypothetical protein [Flavobacteriia bacterium]
MKQTAVEYIKEKLMCNEYWYENMTFDQIFEQAKEMEKEQIIEAYETAMETDIYNEPLKIGKDYYEQTFKSE